MGRLISRRCKFPSRLREGLGEGLSRQAARKFDRPSPDPSHKWEGRLGQASLTLAIATAASTSVPAAKAIVQIG